MKTLEEQMASTRPTTGSRNKATHFVGVPAIMLSLLIPRFSAVRVGLGGITVTRRCVSPRVLAYYFVARRPLALAMLVVTCALLWLAS
jgi:uncharacterized membrane protein YGL010W